MTARQPRRTRRRTAPAASLPRPKGIEGSESVSSESLRAAGRRSTPQYRTHHVTKDYSHVHRDLVTIAGVGVVTIAFIVAMTFVV